MGRSSLRGTGGFSLFRRGRKQKTQSQTHAMLSAPARERETANKPCASDAEYVAQKGGAILEATERAFTKKVFGRASDKHERTIQRHMWLPQASRAADLSIGWPIFQGQLLRHVFEEAHNAACRRGYCRLICYPREAFTRWSTYHRHRSVLRENGGSLDSININIGRYLKREREFETGTGVAIYVPQRLLTQK